MNSSSTYLSSHQAAENPSATCRLTGDDSIAHKESAFYRKARNLSSIHDGMPNLCRIPDGCGLVYIKMLRLSSFFAKNLYQDKNYLKILVFCDPLLRGQQLLPKRRTGYPPKGTGPLPLWTHGYERSSISLYLESSGPLPLWTHGYERGKTRKEQHAPTASPGSRRKKSGRKGPRFTRVPPSPKQVPPCRQLNAPRPSRDRCPSPPAAARKAPCLRGRHPA